MSLIGAIIGLVITAVALLIVSKLPTGVEIDSFEKALVSAFVFGVLNFIANLVLYNPLSKIITIQLLSIPPSQCIRPIFASET